MIFISYIACVGFHKLRYFGIFANGNTEKREKAIQALKEAGRVKQAEKLREKNDEAKMRKCIKCMKGIMFWIAIFHRYYTVQRTIKEQVINKSRKTIDTKIVNTVYD